MLFILVGFGLSVHWRSSSLIASSSRNTILLWSRLSILLGYVHYPPNWMERQSHSLSPNRGLAGTRTQNLLCYPTLRCYTDRYNDQWDSHLPLALYAYCTCTQQRLGCSPFILLHGREPTSLLQTTLDLPDSLYPEVRPIVSWLNQAVSLVSKLSDPDNKDHRTMDVIVTGDLVYKYATSSTKLSSRLLGKDKALSNTWP